MIAFGVRAHTVTLLNTAIAAARTVTDIKLVAAIEPLFGDFCITSYCSSNYTKI